MKLARLSVLAFVLMTLNTNAQIHGDSATAAGSTAFKINASKKFWMGANYRTEWRTPITVPLLKFSEYGGLKPVKKGGGKQTKNLRVEAPDGRQYTLRSIQKFITSKTLPGDLQSEAAADLVQDGVSASYPYSALSVNPLADAAGISHNSARLVYIPDDPALGEYRSEFGNMLALLESRLPDSVSKAFDTDEVVEKLKDDNDNRVDQMALLKARILDMFVMDLDRHEDQWIWGSYDNGKGKTYFPIAKDRDQAFYTNQGLLPGIVKWPWLVPQLEGIKPEAHNIKRFNFAARNLDRFFLNELTEDDWKKATDDFLSHMTDAVIDNAIDKQPREIRDISGEKLKRILKERRKYLAEETMKYFHFLSEIVDVTGSDKKELFDITRNDDGSVHLQVYKITREGNQSSKMYERHFDPKHTVELRMYSFGGDDKFVIHGNEDKIRLRMIGGAGEDMFENAGRGGSAIVYDSTGGNSKLTGPLKDKIANDTLVNSYQRIYYKYNQVIPFVSVGYNQDDGLFLGASLKIIRHGFRKDPYKTLHQFSINHSIATNAFNFGWYSEYIGVMGRNVDVVGDVDIKAPNNTTNFFGYGTNTFYDKTKPGKFRYYRARYQLGDVTFLIRNRVSPKVTISLGPTFEFYNLDADDNVGRYILNTGANGLDPNTLFEKQTYFGGKFILDIDTRNNKVLPMKGIKWTTNLTHLSGISDAAYTVTKLNSEFTVLLPLSKSIVFSNRIGGGHNFGDFEFYQAQYLGSEDNLRGFRKYRFAGQSKVFNNAELRMKVATLKTYLFPAYFGFLFFYDAGRVWSDSAPGNKWVSGYGAGVWFSPLSRIVLTFTYAASKEDRLPLVGVGWKF
jgi:hypothetical protein